MAALRHRSSFFLCIRGSSAQICAISVGLRWSRPDWDGSGDSVWGIWMWDDFFRQAGCGMIGRADTFVACCLDRCFALAMRRGCTALFRFAWSQMVHDCALVPGSSRIHDFFCYAFPPNMRCLLCCMFVRTVTIWNNYYLKASNVDTVPDIMEISLVSCDLLWSTGTTNRSYMFRPLLARSVDGKRMIAALGMLQRLWLFAPETICRQ